MDKIKNDPQRYVTRSQVSLRSETSSEARKVDKSRQDFMSAHIDERFYVDFGSKAQLRKTR
jgi:ribosomal protein L20A (L18A)